MARRKKGSESSGSRAIVNVALVPEVNREVNFACDRYNMLKGQLVRRVLEWFTASPESVQVAVLGNIPSDLRPEYLQKIVEHFTKIVNPPPSPSAPPVVLLRNHEGVIEEDPEAGTAEPVAPRGSAAPAPARTGKRG